jgi:hypothetical protein
VMVRTELIKAIHYISPFLLYKQVLVNRYLEPILLVSIAIFTQKKVRRAIVVCHKKAQ